ncbi:MAG: hypothetical protein ACRDWV_10425 [Acidimicrobiales bacterium]
MRYFLLVYDRRRGQIVEESDFEHEPDALKERFAVEERLGFSSGLEVVVLGAESREALRLTHARYFQSADELLAAGI